MAKVNLDNRIEHLVGLSAKHIFKNLNKPLHKSWLASFTVRSHDRVDKCKIQFKHVSFSQLFFLLALKSTFVDLSFGFLANNCIYSQLDMSRIRKFGEKIRNSQTLAPKSAISYRMSPPYIYIYIYIYLQYCIEKKYRIILDTRKYTEIP